MEWADVILGALVSWSAYRVGIRRERRRKPRPIESPKPVCGCDHHYSHHDKDGKCHAGVRFLAERGQPRTVRTGYEGEKHTVVYDHEQWATGTCPCQRYTGPEPMPTYISLGD